MVGKQRRRGKVVEADVEQPEEETVTAMASSDKSSPKRVSSPNSNLLSIDEQSRGLELLCNQKIIQIGETSSLKVGTGEEAGARVSNVWEKGESTLKERMSRKLAFIEPQQVNDKMIAKIDRDEIKEKMDEMTLRRDRAGFARVLVEMEISGKMPEEIWFEDEDGILQEQKVRYEWQPVQCDKCKGYGHETTYCRKPTVQAWSPKQPVKQKEQEVCLVQTDKAPDKEKKQKQQVTEKDNQNQQSNEAGTVKNSQLDRGKAVEEIAQLVNEDAKGGKGDETESTCKGRILILWKKGEYQISNVQIGDQAIQCTVKNASRCFDLSIIYAHHQAQGRVELWNELMSRGSNNTRPWLVIGDFNSILRSDEKFGGVQGVSQDTGLFQMTIDQCELSEMKTQGAGFTWCNKQLGDKRIMSRLDRALVNKKWMDVFTDAVTWVKPAGLSDHSPLIITWGNAPKIKQKPFRFFNMWITHPEYEELIQEGWSAMVKGTKQHQLIQKLSPLKQQLKALNRRQYADVELQEISKRKNLEEVQQQL
ncbi:OLC1v1025140C1 [Oldenlandia corymbosa var. corymbosa]|uniref:OLC1v1025140C1 n=1 Tax=Oldenlandia corymbosa var. corymbosa TaxID=529605 RepID=A0AAV1C7D9_OLDCO|nr:OLC1v1025140C1 [Oldenlandia corymbosa var. corymbosa]